MSLSYLPNPNPNPTCVLLIFHSLQSICMLNFNSVALAVREIFTGVRKFKYRSLKLGHVPSDLVFCMPSKLLLVIDALTKFEISMFSCSKDIRARILQIWASSAILDSTLGEFDNFATSAEPQSTTL